jgi:hypothetical protein
MNNTVMITTLLALFLVIFIFVRQIIQRPVTRRSLLLPLIVSVASGGVFLLSHSTFEGIIAVLSGALFGVGTGLISGRVIRVWCDEATGIVLQRGGWRYALVLIVLLLLRVLIRIVFIRAGGAVDEAALNAALIAALVGNFLGRDIHIALRALRLSGGSFARLSGRVS